MKNKTIEDKAIEIIISQLKNQTVKRAKKGSGYDIKIGNKKIEVKGTSSNNPNAGFLINSIQELVNLLNGGYIYRLTNVGKKGTKRLYKLRGKDISINLEFRARVTIKKHVKGVKVNAQRPPKKNR